MQESVELIQTPLKPFDGYKWRWATLTPTEGLNEPPIFLGVLRAMADHEGEPPSSASFMEDLRRVERDTRGIVSTRLSLTRTPDRNLIRNSGQYWKALGLIEDSIGRIGLTEFGRRVAGGDVTRDEFSAATIRTLALPNTRIEPNISEWRAAGVSLRPLQLILGLLGTLRREYGAGSDYVTPFELCRIVIPLAGMTQDAQRHAMSISAFRRDALDVTNWPNCTPASNDRRMAREFLLFLYHYGYLTKVGEGFEGERFHLQEGFQDVEVRQPPQGQPVAQETFEDPGTTIGEIREAESVTFVQRQRVLTQVYERPSQPRFRRAVLEAYRYRCILTGEPLPDVLEAGHIIPVRYNGSDDVSNGICLRSDIHLLFDLGHIRISAEGTVRLSEVLQGSPSYRSLPSRVVLPGFVSVRALEWRWNYC